jgi:hypothetical protein
LVFGDIQKKKKIVKLAILFSIMMAIYAICFPGVFTFNTSFNTWHLNFIIRANDFIDAIMDNSLIKINVKKFAGDPYVNTGYGGRQSGYAVIANALPYLGVVGIFILPTMLKGIKKLKRYSPELKNVTISCLLTVFLIPLITSFLGRAIFSFIAGFAFLPLFLLSSNPWFEWVLYKNRNRFTAA